MAVKRLLAALWVLALLALGNVVFWIYDVALSRIITAYREVLRKKIFRRIG